MKKIIYLVCILFYLFSFQSTAQNLWKGIQDTTASVYYGAFNLGRDGYFYCTRDEVGVFRTNDDVTFTISGGWPSPSGAISSVNAKTGYVFVGSYSTSISYNNGHGVRIATDYSTWNSSNNGLGADTSVNNILIMPNGNILVDAENIWSGAPTEYALYLSTNNGATWQKKISSTSALGICSMSVISSNEVFIVGSQSYKTTDNGVTLTTLPYQFAGDGCYLPVGSNGDLFRIGVSGSGDSYVQISHDKAGIWNNLLCNGLPKAPRELVITSHDTLFAMGDSIYRSVDKGINWTSFMAGLPTNTFGGGYGGLGLSKGGYLYCGPYMKGLYRTVSRVYTPNFTEVDELNPRENSLNIFPNPITHSAIIQSDIDLKNAEMIIYDISGRKVLNRKFDGDRLQIDKGSLEHGFYTVIIFGEGKTFTQRLIVQ